MVSSAPGMAHCMVLGAPQEYGLFEMYWPQGPPPIVHVLPRPYGIIFRGLLVGMALAGAVIVMDSLNLL